MSVWITCVTLFYQNFRKTQTVISLFKTLLGSPLLLGKSELSNSFCWIEPLLPLQALGPPLSVLQPHWLSFGFTLGFTFVQLPSSAGPLPSLSLPAALSPPSLPLAYPCSGLSLSLPGGSPSELCY